MFLPALASMPTKLTKLGLLKRVGSDKGGYWEVLSEDTEE